MLSGRSLNPRVVSIRPLLSRDCFHLCGVSPVGWSSTSHRFTQELHIKAYMRYYQVLRTSGTALPSAVSELRISVRPHPLCSPVFCYNDPRDLTSSSLRVSRVTCSGFSSRYLPLFHQLLTVGWDVVTVGFRETSFTLVDHTILLGLTPQNPVLNDP